MSYESAQRRAGSLFKRTRTAKCHNLTTNTPIRAGINEADTLQVALDDAHLVQPGNLIQVPSGDTLFISDSGQREALGIQSFPAAKVSYFAKLYRFAQEPTDSFGRPPAAPQLVNDQIPLCSWQGVFYTSSAIGIRQGDVLRIEEDDFIVLGTNFINVHTIRLAIQKQH